MNEFELDLAVIGNDQDCCSSGARVSSGVVVLSSFNGDPVFSRLLAGDEEKGFCDVVLDGMVNFSSDYEHNTPSSRRF